MVSFITIPAVTLHGMTAFPCHNLGGKRRLVSGCAFGFQHFHHLVGGGGGSALFEVAGNHKDGEIPKGIRQWDTLVCPYNVVITGRQ